VSVSYRAELDYTEAEFPRETPPKVRVEPGGYISLIGTLMTTGPSVYRLTYSPTNTSYIFTYRTETQRAIDQFVAAASGHPNVLRVEPPTGNASAERPIRVYVRRGDFEARFQVYDLENAFAGYYPGAQFEVLVLEAGAPATTHEESPGEP
jgi:hypothetical protein